MKPPPEKLDAANGSVTAQLQAGRPRLAIAELESLGHMSTLMTRLRSIQLWRWITGAVLSVIVLMAKLPATLRTIPDAQGLPSGRMRPDPFLVGWTFAYVAIALACILFGGRIAQIIGIVLLVIGLVS